MLRLTLLMTVFALTACASAGPLASPKSPGEVDYQCKVDADCAVKDVGNCCGHYPACVNRDSPTFPERVRAACMKSGASSICGFPEIQSCRCVQNVCAAQDPTP